MSLDVVKKLASELGNEELSNALKGVEDTFSKNVEKLNYYEKELQSSIEKRDKQSSLVKSKLGLDDLSEDSIDSFLSGVSEKGSEEFEAEKRKLESMVSEFKEKYSKLESEYIGTVNMHKIERGLNDLGARKEADGSRAYDILLQEATRGASFEDGELVFKANDGTTIRNADGTPMSLADRYAQIKDSEEFGFLFVKEKPKSGSGVKSQKGGSGGIPTTLEGMSDVERTRLYKQDPELFRKLSKGK